MRWWVIPGVFLVVWVAILVAIGITSSHRYGACLESKVESVPVMIGRITMLQSREVCVRWEYPKGDKPRDPAPTGSRERR